MKIKEMKNNAMMLMPATTPNSFKIWLLVSAKTAKPIAAGIDQDAGEPRLESVRVVERAEPPPGGDNRVMRRVLSLDGISQDDGSETVRPIELTVGESSKDCTLIGRRDCALEVCRHHAETMPCMFYLTIWARQSFTRQGGSSSRLRWEVGPWPGPGPILVPEEGFEPPRPQGGSGV